MKIGIGFSGFKVHKVATINDMVDLCRYAEELGFHSGWIPENYYTNDAIVAATAVALKTKNMQIGTGIISPILRNPVLIAMTFTTLDEVSQGRTIIGIGKTPRVVLTEQLGVSVKSPMQFFRETVRVLNELMSGQEVNIDGEYLKLKRVKLEAAPKRKHVPIYLAAVGPNTLKLAGQIADGVILGDLSSPEYVKFAAKTVREEAGRVGRDPDKLEIVGYVLTSLGKDAMSDHKRTLAYFLPRKEQDFNIVALRSGATPEIFRKVKMAAQRRDLEEGASYVTDEMVKYCTAIGTKEECAEKLKEYYRAGMTVPIICPAGDRSKETVKAISDSL